jgi:hypothetical protein
MRLAPTDFQTRLLVLAFAIAPCAHGQYIVNPDRLSPALRNMEWRPDDRRLNCSVGAIKPALNFGFRFEAGYIVRVPMGQYSGKGHRWSILTRVTPEGGTPVYFLSRYNLPEIPRTNTELEVGGGYLVGEGRYRVSWKLQDESGRVCRQEWKFEARRSRSESKVKVGMSPNTVDAFSNWTVGGRRTTDDAAPVRLTVLLHAAPSSPRRVRMAARDRFLLLGTLSALLERIPTRSVRVVVFNLDQQKELYRSDDFGGQGLVGVSRALDALELGQVDYQVLQNPRGHVDLLAEIVNREVSAAPSSDVVLFLGPMSRYYEKMPDTALDKSTGAGPRFFYFQYRPPSLRMQSTLPDIIHSAVSRLKGKTVVIHSPGDFAKGIEQVEHITR